MKIHVEEFPTIRLFNKDQYEKVLAEIENSELPKETIEATRLMLLEAAALSERLRELELINVKQRELIYKKSTEIYSIFNPDAKVIPSPESSTESENTPAVNPNNKNDDAKPYRKGRRRLDEICTETIHAVGNESADNACKCCGKGSYRKSYSEKKYRIVARPMFIVEKHVIESIACNACGHTVKAAIPEAVKKAIGRYSYSAVATIAYLRYATGVPNYRLETLSAHAGFKITDSTSWSLMENAAAMLLPLYKYFQKVAANSDTAFIDDTHMKIITVKKEADELKVLAVENGKNPKEIRTGIHTTNISTISDNGKIVFYKTGIHNAGEVFKSVLDKRTSERSMNVMSDALASNFKYKV